MPTSVNSLNFIVNRKKSPSPQLITFNIEPGRRQGFTLLELLVAIVILGILAGIVARTNTVAQQKARDAVRKKNLNEMAVAIRAAYSDRWDSPAKGRNNYPAEPGTQCAGIGAITWGNAWTIGTTTYIERLPTDPKSGITYCYDINSTSQSYRLSAKLEFAQDPDLNSANCPANHGANSYNYCVDENGIIKGVLPFQ